MKLKIIFILFYFSLTSNIEDSSSLTNISLVKPIDSWQQATFKNTVPNQRKILWGLFYSKDMEQYMEERAAMFNQFFQENNAPFDNSYKELTVEGRTYKILDPSDFRSVQYMEDLAVLERYHHKLALKKQLQGEYIDEIKSPNDYLLTDDYLQEKYDELPPIPMEVFAIPVDISKIIKDGQYFPFEPKNEEDTLARKYVITTSIYLTETEREGKIVFE